MAVVLTILVLNLIFKDRVPALQTKQTKETKAAKVQQTQPADIVVVIDPGHGGKDPGKVGINDALEKDINLAIALYLQDYLEQNGLEVILTRDTDKGLYSQTATNKKKEDLEARVKLANEAKPAIVVSLHQNSYTDSSCKGSQVFFYKDAVEGEALAKSVQSAMLYHVDPNNKRKIKANDNYYILKEISAPTIIIECGFLSNPSEAQSLTQQDYQKKVAQGISIGVINYLMDQKAQ